MHRAIGRCLNVKERINKFVRTHEPAKDAKYHPWDDRLNMTDWRYIERLHTCLEEYHDCIIVAEGSKAKLTDFFQTLHYLLNAVDGWQQEANEDLNNDLATSLHASWRKIEKYYGFVDQTPIYYAAILLDPTLKAHWFHENWTSDKQVTWIEPTIALVRNIWVTKYKPRLQPTYQPQRNGEDEPMGRLQSSKRLRLSGRPALFNQFDEYLSSDPVEFTQDFDVIRYWFAHQYTWPELSKFALDTFAIPLMSDDNERSFSAARDMITYKRTRLQSDIIEACQCLKDWLKLESCGLEDPESDDESNTSEIDTSSNILPN